MRDPAGMWAVAVAALRGDTHTNRRSAIRWGKHTAHMQHSKTWCKHMQHKPNTETLQLAQKKITASFLGTLKTPEHARACKLLPCMWPEKWLCTTQTVCMSFCLGRYWRTFRAEFAKFVDHVLWLCMVFYSRHFHCLLVFDLFVCVFLNSSAWSDQGHCGVACVILEQSPTRGCISPEFHLHTGGVWWRTAAAYFTSGTLQSGPQPSACPDCGDETG